MPSLMFDLFVDSIPQGRKDLALMAGGGSIDRQGTLRIAGRFCYAAGSLPARILAVLPQTPAEPLAALPKTRYVLGVSGLLPQSLGSDAVGTVTALGTIAAEFAGASLGLGGMASASTLIVAAPSSNRLRGFSLSLAAGEPGEAAIGSVTASAAVDDAPAMLAEIAEQIEADRVRPRALDKEVPKKDGENRWTVTAARKTSSDGKPAVEIEAAIKVRDSYEKGLYGEGAYCMRMAAADKNRLVLAFAASKRTAAELVEKAGKPETRLVADPDVAATAAMLDPVRPMDRVLQLRRLDPVDGPACN